MILSNVLRGFRALIGERLWDALVSEGATRSFPSGSFLLRQGDPGGSVLVLLRGRVQVTGHDQQGAELLVSLRAGGDLVGEIAGVPQMTRTASVQAIDHCTAQVLTAEKFRDFLKRNRIDGHFTDYLLGKLSETVPYQMQLVHFTARRRLARLMLELVVLADPGHPDRMRVPFSQESLARALGLSRSTVAEQIAALRELGALTAGRRLVVADLDKLAGSAGL